MKNLLKELKKYPVIIFFGILLYTISIADLFSPVEEFSELENRSLATFPKFSWKLLFDNEYTPKIETFTEDHFIMRDSWISLKSISESVLGKIENNGVVYGDDGYMFTKFTTVDYSQMEKNINAINKFVQRHSDRNISFMLVPTAAGVMKDKLFTGSPVIDTDYILDYAKENVTANFVDVSRTMEQHKDEYIYYRTDHHWTTHGAYYAYSDYMNSIGRTPKDENDFEYVDVDNFLGTHYSKAKSYNVNSDVLSFVKNDSLMTTDGETYSEIYDYDKLSVRDKYAMFLRGNYGFLTVKGNGSGKIMILKDSYANCFIPFMTDDFEQIDVIDLRYISVGLDSYIEENDYDRILFLYNCESFIADKNLSKVNLFN